MNKRWHYKNLKAYQFFLYTASVIISSKQQIDGLNAYWDLVIRKIFDYN